ncbi:NAD-dependent epimerase/dehydratase family protein [Nocardioides sp.]|uniref:NAD-dependent epimerase/dehydratase family protein n=1 Tax=Nocardioides sp. TaxID=35761 RepID=UPI00352965A5
MRLLIIGGTRFVGHAMAEAALAAGHEVTVLHRNATEDLPDARHLLADRDGDLSALGEGTWDATIDTCAYLPGQVASLADALGDRGGHHLLVSTVSVYAEPAAAGATEDAELLAAAEPEVTEVTGETYGPLKVACEAVARSRYADAGLTLVRPTYVVGPRDYTGRFPWWVRRLARGGPTLAPGPSDAPMQAIDARDMGRWVVALAADRVAGTFTAARPATTFGQLLEETAAALGSSAELVRVDGDWLVGQGVDAAQLPLWSEGTPEQALAMSTDRAESVGLTHRPWADVVRDTLAWAEADPESAAGRGLGLSPEREQELLAAWRARA